jgi:gas vesicle protein
MTFVLGSIVGVLIGAAILYVTQRSQLKTLETKLRQVRRELEKIEADFQSQMQQTIGYLRQAYDRESTQKNEETVQQYQKEIRNLKHEHQVQIEKLQAKNLHSQTSIVSNPSVIKPIAPLQVGYEEDSEFPFDAFNDSFLEAENALNDPEFESYPPVPIQNQSLPDFLSEEPPLSPDRLDLGLDSLETEDSFLNELASFLSETPRITFDRSSEKLRSESPSFSPSEAVKDSQPNAIDQILAMQTVDRIPQLGDRIYHSDPQVRAAVAKTIGSIAESGNIKPKISQCLPILDKLIRDNDVTVRRSAVLSLGKIRSEKVIPLIRLALKDNDSEVVRLASKAIGRFRVYPNSNKPVKKPSHNKKANS